jgi:chemotaxis protein histidine kinase CheA
MEEDAMQKEQPTELFMPPNILKAKVGGTIAGLDTAAIKRAEKAMEELKGEFSDWIAKDITHLSEAYGAFAADLSASCAGDLFRASHDLKGQAATFEYPLIARVASSLSKLMDEMGSPDKIPLALVQAHVEAIHVIHRDKIKDISDRTALTLVEELEARVIKTLARTSHKG